MTSSHKLLGGVLILAFALGGAAFPSGKKTEDNRAVSLPMEMVADYLHAVIEANREVYTKHVVERLQARGVVVASENWEYQQNTMPLPAQLLMESDRVLERNGSGIQYRLISQWPINKRNVASGEFQKNGLGAISAHPTKPFTGYVTVGQARYFQAVYPDLAVTEGCIGCHNAHPESAKHDFKLNDVIGAMVISIPVK